MVSISRKSNYSAVDCLLDNHDPFTEKHLYIPRESSGMLEEVGFNPLKLMLRKVLRLLVFKVSIVLMETD